MKRLTPRPAIDLLEQEIAAREALDPYYFDALKADSLKQLLAMGVEISMAKGLLNHG